MKMRAFPAAATAVLFFWLAAAVTTSNSAAAPQSHVDQGYWPDYDETFGSDIRSETNAIKKLVKKV